MNLGRRLASQSAVIFVARLLGAGLIFLVQALIARFWGAQVLGEYLIIIATVNLIAILVPLGFQTVATYFASEYRAKGDRHQLIAFLTRAYGHVIFMFVLLLLAGPIVLELIGQGEGTLSQHFLPVCLLVFGTAMVSVNGTTLVGLKRPFAGFFADTVFRPMVVIGSFAIAATLLNSGDAFDHMLWLIAIGFVIISLVHFGYVLATVPRVENLVPKRIPELPRWWRFAAPWVVIAMATDFFFDIDLLLLSHALNHEELAIFGVCTRIFSLVSFGVAAVYAVTLPDIFESEANSDREAFHRKVGEANMMASLISLALFAIMVVAGPFALSLFGPSFTAGALPLAILCLALVVRSAFGPASIVLSIHDRPWSSLPAILLGMGTLVVGNWVLVPMFHLVGAALAAIIAITVWSGSLWLIALHTAHVDVSILQWFRTRRAARSATAS